MLPVWEGGGWRVSSCPSLPLPWLSHWEHLPNCQPIRYNPTVVQFYLPKLSAKVNSSLMLFLDNFLIVSMWPVASTATTNSTIPLRYHQILSGHLLETREFETPILGAGCICMNLGISSASCRYQLHSLQNRNRRLWRESTVPWANSQVGGLEHKGFVTCLSSPKPTPFEPRHPNVWQIWLPESVSTGGNPISLVLCWPEAQLHFIFLPNKILQCVPLALISGSRAFFGLLLTDYLWYSAPSPSNTSIYSRHH